MPAVALQRALTSPALRARQTAEALHCVATIDPALRDCDYGRWTRRSLEAVLADEPDSLASWMADPAASRWFNSWPGSGHGSTSKRRSPAL